MAAQTAATPFLSRPDVIVSASPSFPALLPAIANVRARRIPWVLWLHDLLPDGATATGLVDEGGTVIKLARRLERAAYRAADRIVVLSRAFTDEPRRQGRARGEDRADLRPGDAGARRATAEPGTQGGRAADPLDGQHRALAGADARWCGAFEARPELAAGACS